MTDREHQDALKTLLEELKFMDDEDRADAGLDSDLTDIAEVRTFDEAGVMSTNAGLVLAMADGGEFQVTIVRSR